MGTMIGFAIGYTLGTRAGDRGWEELQEVWRTVSSSEEVKDLLTGGLATARDLLGQGAAMLASRLGQVGQPGLRSVA